MERSSVRDTLEYRRFNLIKFAVSIAAKVSFKIKRPEVSDDFYFVLFSLFIVAARFLEMSNSKCTRLIPDEYKEE